MVLEEVFYGWESCCCRAIIIMLEERVTIVISVSITQIRS